MWLSGGEHAGQKERSMLEHSGGVTGQSNWDALSTVSDGGKADWGVPGGLCHYRGICNGLEFIQMEIRAIGGL